MLSVPVILPFVGHRLSKISTRTGDMGTTGLGDGSRISKSEPSVHALGEVDELNSFIGLLLTHQLPDQIREILIDCQHALFDLGAELAVPGTEKVSAVYTVRLERSLERFNADLPPLREFILPGGSSTVAVCHVARAVCRRAERTLVSLDNVHKVNAHTLTYLNRLSDLLFVIARVLARQSEGGEVYWDPSRLPER